MKRLFLKILLSILIIGNGLTTSVDDVQANNKTDTLLITWDTGDNAVYYEIQISTDKYFNKIVYDNANVCTPGIEIERQDLKSTQSLSSFYYRIRTLNIDKHPLSNWSSTYRLNSSNLNPQKPYTTALISNPAPLYPVYSWIPVLHAKSYQIEILSRLPESNKAPSKYAIQKYTVTSGFDLYDQKAYTSPGTYYWRIVAQDQNGRNIGLYSTPIPFVVESKEYQFAAIGDSITHGGGAISNPPSDIRFDYTKYLMYETKNLGKSGDTLEAILDRFDEDVLPFHPKYLIIFAGTNSLRGGLNPETAISYYEQLKDKCESYHITPIFVTLPPINPERIQRVFGETTADGWQERFNTVNEYLRQQQYVADPAPLLTDANGFLNIDYATDGLHPDIGGKKIIATCINQVMAHILKLNNSQAVPDTTEEQSESME